MPSLGAALPTGMEIESQGIIWRRRKVIARICLLLRDPLTTNTIEGI
jgi:hypothetical protein